MREKSGNLQKSKQMKDFLVKGRDIHMDAPNNSNETHAFHVSGQSRPIWAALKLL